MTQGKNIVLCSDGTGNTANKGRGTNVWKVFEAVDLNGHKENRNLKRQVAFYDDGVGTERMKLLKLITGAVGIGLKRNVKQLYTELCRAYEAGDDLYLFGFSRGAFTVRTLAGLIEKCGIVETHPRATPDDPVSAAQAPAPRPPIDDAALETLVDEAYRQFRKHFRRPWSDRLHAWLPFSSSAEAATAAFRRRHAVKHPVHAPDGTPKIRFVGVWDTVDAVGLPIDELASLMNAFWPYKFPDRKLGTHVRKGCHALAIDDERRSFHPTMWDETGEGESENRIEQVWFAGVHSNVGGGYPKQGLSLVSLCWMMQKAQREDLRFLDDSFRRYRERTNAGDKLYDSRAGLAIYYRYSPRDIAELCLENGIAEPKVHVSVLQRTAQGTEGYAPGNLPGSFGVVPFDPDRRLAGEEPAALEAVVREISGGRPESRPLLLDRSEVRRWIWTRRLSHYALLVATLVVFALAGAVEPPRPDSTTALKLLYAALSSLPLLGERLYAVVVGSYGWLLLVLAALFLIGETARRRLTRLFSRFWRASLRRDWDAAKPARNEAA